MALPSYSSPFVRLVQAGANAATFALSADYLTDPWAVNDFNAEIDWLPSSADPAALPGAPTDNGFSTLPNGPLKDLFAKQYAMTDGYAQGRERQDAFGAAGATITVTKTDGTPLPADVTILGFSGWTGPGDVGPCRVQVGISPFPGSYPPGYAPHSILVRIAVAYSAST